MSQKIENSSEIYSNSLDLFQVPPTDVSASKVHWVDYSPVSPLTDSAPIEFLIPGSGSAYLDLQRCYLYLKLKIKGADGSDLDPADGTALINLPTSSIWKNVDLILQDTLISNSDANYPYKAYIETLLDFGPLGKGASLQAAGYYKDRALHFDQSDGITGTNSGLKLRCALTGDSRIADFIAPLHLDLAQQGRLLLNGVPVQVKLWPSRNAFRLMSPKNAEYEVVITQACLRCCKYMPSPAILLAHAEALKKDPARYYYQKTVTKALSIKQDDFSLSAMDLFQGACPDLIVLGMVSANAYNGDYKLNPFNMKLYDISSAALYVDDESVPGAPQKFNMSMIKGPNYIEGFQALYSALGKFYDDDSIDISRAEYPAGYGLIAFKPKPEHNDIDGSLPLTKRGNVRLEINFQKGLPENVVVIVYARFPAVMSIDASRSVIL